MVKRQIKNVILIGLITLSIWQTGKLWLGDLSGLSFFAPSKKNMLEQIEPESIWIVPGAPGTLIYRLGEENREYQSVRDEIEKNIRTYLQVSKIEKESELDWKEIFTRKGILYEYPMPVTYGEMIGVTVAKDKSLIQEIDYIFIPLSDDYGSLTKWQLISSEEKKSIAINVQGQFENMKAFRDLLSDEVLTYKVKYQPTFGMVGISNENLFLPISSKDTPISYDVLEWHNPLEQEEDLNKFNPYINHYFLNPLLKKEEITDEGVYIFSELMKAVVKYDPSGIFEYSNIGATKNRRKIPRLEAYNIGRAFLQKNESMTKEIKNTLFLSKIEETMTGYIFHYDMRVKGVPLYFSAKERKRLGMDHMAQITVVGSEVSNFKWNASEVRPKTRTYASDPKTNYFNMKYTEAINKVLEYAASKKELSNLVIDDMRWVYMISGAHEDVQVRWIVLYDGEWYSP